MHAKGRKILNNFGCVVLFIRQYLLNMDELVVGTYEGFLLGYKTCTTESGIKLKQTFATHSHTASVRCISVGGRFLASGGTDDKVVVIDLKTRKEHTVLMNHDGTINTVAITHSGTHILTGSDDGSIVVTRSGNWQIEKIWKKAHGGSPVTAIAIHPTDKLALSIGGDNTLRTWNLLKGRPAFTINLGSKGVTMPTEVKFTPGGDKFSVVHQKTVDVWSITSAGLVKRITCTSKPTTVQWVSDDRLYIGLENGNIITTTVSDEKALTYQAHKQRVKSLHYYNELLYSASSLGELKVWSVEEEESKLVEIVFHNAACRVTCVTLIRHSDHIKKEEEGLKAEDNNNVTSEENEDSDEAEEVQSTPQKKSRAYVTVSYGDETNKEEKDTDINSPPKKKFKKRKRNKKPQKQQNIE